MIIAIIALAAIGIIFLALCSSYLVQILTPQRPTLVTARGWLALAFLVLVAILALGIIDLATGHL